MLGAYSTDANHLPVAAVVLAAGGSRRMGRPKQLLPVAGSTLVRHSVAIALECRCDAVFAVLGAAAPEVAEAVAGLDVSLVSNPDWESGLGGSIGAGLRAVAADERRFQGVLLMLTDQPRVTAAVLDELLDVFRAVEVPQASAIVACEYSGTVGVPAIFGRAHFTELGRLEGDAGAKVLLARRRGDLQRVRFEAAGVDIDTPADYSEFSSKFNSELS